MEIYIRIHTNLLYMGTIERDNNGRGGFCKYCGETGLHPLAKVCDKDDCEPSDSIFKECAYYKCRNILGPVSPESNDKYCREHPG